MKQFVFPVGLTLLSASAAAASPVLVPVNTATSNVTISVVSTIATPLGNATASSMDTSRVAGYTWIKLAPASYAAPTLITLYDFRYELIDTVDIVLNYRIGIIPVGAFTAHSQPAPNNVILSYAAPFMPALPPAAVAANGAFTYANVSTTSTGMFNYTATGAVCTIFGTQVPPQPCTGVSNIGGTQPGDFTGTVTVSAGRTVILLANPNSSSPIDPTNPSAGTLTVSGTVQGVSAVLPRRGDANFDGVTDSGDIQLFVNTLISPGPLSDTTNWQRRFAVDMNDDDVFDGADAALFVTCLLGNGCPA